MRIVSLTLCCIACSAPPTVVIVQPQSQPQRAPASGVAATASVALSAHVLRPGTTQPVAVGPGQVLVAKDEVALDVELDRDAYVYVMYVDARGTVSELFPKAASPRVGRGSQWFPRNGRAWQLDATTGTESFVVLAAAGPLDDAARRSLAEVWKPAALRAPATPPPPPQIQTKVKSRMQTSINGTDPDLRAPEEIVDGIVASPDRNGVAMAAFTFEHR